MNTIKKTSRSAETRLKKARLQPWRPPSALDAPEPPPGYKHRWLRVESLGFDDKKNISSRLREGFELVRAEEYPDFEAPTVDNGKHAGVIGVGIYAYSKSKKSFKYMPLEKLGLLQKGGARRSFFR